MIILFALYSMVLHSYRGAIASKYSSIAASVLYLGFFQLFFMNYGDLRDGAPEQVRAGLPPPSMGFNVGVAIALILPTLAMVFWAASADQGEGARALR